MIGGHDSDYKLNTQQGINNSYAVIVVNSALLAEHRWARKQLLWAREKRRPIFLAAREAAEPDSRIDLSDLPVFDDVESGIDDLLDALPVPRVIDGLPGRERLISQRWLELNQLDLLRFERMLSQWPKDLSG
jgi:hypothetical protein